MKLSLLFSLLLCGQLNAQTGSLNLLEPSQKVDFITFGMTLGYNHSNLSIRKNDRSTGTLINGPGFRFGFNANFQLNEQLSIIPKFEFAFNGSKIEESEMIYKMNPIVMEVMGHVKYKWLLPSINPYIIVGPNIRMPIQSGTNIYSNRDVAIDLGAGIDLPISWFSISPEIRYSFGIGKTMEETAFSNIRYHNITCALIFSLL